MITMGATMSVNRKYVLFKGLMIMTYLECVFATDVETNDEEKDPV